MEPLYLNSPVHQLAHEKRFSPYYKNPLLSGALRQLQVMEFKLVLTGPSSCIPPLSRAVILLTVPQRLTFGLIPPLPRRWSVLARHVRDAHRTGLIHAPDAPGRARGRCTPATLFAGRFPQAPDRGIIPSAPELQRFCLLYLSNDSNTVCLLPLFFGAPLQDFPQEILGAAGGE